MIIWQFQFRRCGLMGESVIGWAEVAKWEFVLTPQWAVTPCVFIKRCPLLSSACNISECINCGTDSYTEG